MLFKLAIFVAMIALCLSLTNAAVHNREEFERCLNDCNIIQRSATSRGLEPGENCLTRCQQ